MVKSTSHNRERIIDKSLLSTNKDSVLLLVVFVTSLPLRFYNHYCWFFLHGSSPAILTAQRDRSIVVIVIIEHLFPQQPLRC